MTDRRLGCIADDYTGATDLCSMLVRAGRRVIQCFGIPAANAAISGMPLANGSSNPTPRDVPAASGMPPNLDADAIVVALKSRSIASADAVAASLDALRFLRAWGADRFFFKYCSTFDSTPSGNIGPVAEALADDLGSDLLLFCPAFPENGRTVHCGHLFVDGVPLHESGLRNHPLNPMTDSNLVRVLQAQSKRTVTWVRPDGQPASLDASSLIVDAVTDADLQSAARLAESHLLLTGGSAIAGHWADALGVRKSDDWPETDEPQNESSPAVILAGSCSDATRQQVAEFEKTHPVLHLNIDGSACPQTLAAETLAWCKQQWQAKPRPVLITSSAKPESVAAARQALGQRAAAELTEQVFAAIAVALKSSGVTRMIVAGGETSGAVINALDVKAVQIGREIAPGVPWVTSVGPPRQTLALKSGNFGDPRFFLDALEMPR